MARRSRASVIVNFSGLGFGTRQSGGEECCREARTCRESPRGGATARRVCEQQRPPLASCCFSLRERQLPARVGVDRNRDRMARECIVRIRLTVGGSNGLPLC